MSTGEKSTPEATGGAAGPSNSALFAFCWIWVGVPMGYGLYELILKAVQLFTGG